MKRPYLAVGSDARNAIAHARATGSVEATYNGTKAERLYAYVGASDRFTPSGWWMVTYPDGSTGTIHEENL